MNELANVDCESKTVLGLGRCEGQCFFVAAEGVAAKKYQSRNMPNRS